MVTHYQTKYFAWQLTRRLSSEDKDKLTGAILDAQIDLKPYQVDAALFAFRNPLNKGVLLADEVGLGKTIEAGLVIAQKWAERKRRILIIVPASLRSQWYQEMREKFGIDGMILESASYNELKKEGKSNPFDTHEGLVICSYQFVRTKADDVGLVPWDLAVIDEAHRLRNVYKKNNKTSKAIKEVLTTVDKVLLTATPLQNSLLELYGLISIIDERVFGDPNNFRVQYGQNDGANSLAGLKHRISPFCRRTLRRQVQEYVSYTNRIAMVERFTPNNDERRLYDLVSEYLRRPMLNALPSSQRQLISMVMWKLLASSSFAVAGALATMIHRLEKILEEMNPDDQGTINEIRADYETLDETSEEWEEQPAVSFQERKSISAEIEELRGFKDLAERIRHNSKGNALLKALKIGFERLRELGASEKAIVFTESRKTQNYLQELLSDSEYGEGIVLFNGSNNNDKAKRIYEKWLDRHQGSSDKVTGSRAADTRAALVEYFRDDGRIMIATEAAAEGLNLQFCSLVINYDLPWNPQRVEQRIGRCHRYGQKHDVVVLNFIDLTNEADRRVYELLDQKFRLFSGVFGASDEVLGAIESGVDFERRIKDIYQTCRTPEQIERAFKRLQVEMSSQINSRMLIARERLFEHFDEDVLQKIKIDSTASLDRYGKMLLSLTKGELDDLFTEIEGGFILKNTPSNVSSDIPTGRYFLPRYVQKDSHVYRLNHPLAQGVIRQAKERVLLPAKLIFDYEAAGTQVTVIRQLRGCSGELTAHVITVESLKYSEDYVVLCGRKNNGEVVDQEVLGKLLNFPVSQAVESRTQILDNPNLEKEFDARKTRIIEEAFERSLKYFDAEAEKLDAWSEDLKTGLEKEIKDLDKKIREFRGTARKASNLDEKLQLRKYLHGLEKQRGEKRRELFSKQDEVDSRREELIFELENSLKQKVKVKELFRISWEVA